ncbi:MAG: hypothetical protein AB8B69_03820 [Chitinophagales bacterium]
MSRVLIIFSLCFSSLFMNSTLDANVLMSVPHSPVGTYAFEITDIPDQADIKGTMVVSKVDGKVRIVFKSSLGEFELQDAKLDGHKLTGKTEFLFPGVVLKLGGTFTPSGFKGQFNTEFGHLPITATKK